MIEFDPVKNSINIHERGLPFQLAALLFDGPFVEDQDSRQDYGEPRFIAIGPIAALDHHNFVVAYTWCGANRRIVSFRKDIDREVKKYRASLPR